MSTALSNAVNGLDVLGVAYIVGGEADIGALARKLDALAAGGLPTLEQAAGALKLAVEAINNASNVRRGANVARVSPGGVALFTDEIKDSTDKTVAANLRLHMERMTSLLQADYTTFKKPYTTWPDLRKWIVSSFVQFNAALASAQYSAEAGSVDKFWADVDQGFDDLLKKTQTVITKILELPFKAGGAAARGILDAIPWWAWAGGAVVLGGMVFGPWLFSHLRNRMPF